MLARTLLKQDKDVRAISPESPATIAAFAQLDDVKTFLSGIGQDLEHFVVSTIREVLVKRSPKELSNAVQAEFGLDAVESDRLRTIAEKMGEGSYDTIKAEMDSLSRERYVNPILSATRFLQKGELAAMAEMLVNMVSFRKQVTLTSETVGGPIDVAVITKGDGLIWTRRKHYFDPALNPHFTTTYFDDGAGYVSDAP